VSGSGAKRAGQRQVPLTGYSDRLSLRGGERIAFKVSTSGAPRRIRARLLRSISSDPNPDGPGIVERACDEHFAPVHFTGRHQPLLAGSYGVSHAALDLAGDAVVSLEVLAWPTLRCERSQCLLWAGGITLELDACGHFVARFGPTVVVAPQPAVLRHWARVRVVLDRGAGTLSLSAWSGDAAVLAEAVEQTVEPDAADAADAARPVTIGARLEVGAAVDHFAVDHFNGKLEAPTVRGGASVAALGVRASWDFARSTSTTRIEDTGPHGLHGRLVNFPARAMTGAAWDGSETCWRHAPAHYGAIHFHDDDLIDAGWLTDFVFDAPRDLPSGAYVMRIDDGEHEDAMPFWVCAPRGAPTADLCVLVSTFTYSVYGNHARPDWAPDWQARVAQWNAYPWNPAQYPDYGLSTYNVHSDGSGICHASHRRPLFNLRPGYVTFAMPEHQGSGLRHVQADGHLLAWLHAKGIACDVITDQELHDEGVDCLAPYRAVSTGTHPEYHTANTLDALAGYRDGGGSLLYLGGNGFYWRVALHAEAPSTIEIRRAEAGIRAWAAEPGEYWQAFDGAYGGLWRRNGRAPQALVGVGFSAQGEMNGSHYRRCNHDPRFDWVFDGIQGDTFGGFGLCGGGAAGFELDRADVRLGTPPEAVVLASSEGHGEDFVLVPEEVLTHLTTLPGEPAASLLHADILWHDTPAGGAVFSVGSITFCGALPCNDFDNDVSRLLGNVLDRLLNPKASA